MSRPPTTKAGTLARRLAPVLTALAASVLVAGAPSAADPRAPVKDGAPAARGVQLRSFTSSALGGVEHYAVYLPAGYATSGKRYPVIYALHGLPAGPNAYQRMPVAAWGHAAEQAGRPAIVVSPQGARRGDADPEWHDWKPGRNWESAVAHDLLQEVDRTYRTIRDRRARAIIGISAGGYGASIIGVRHPKAYSVIQSWSGYFHPTDPAGDAPLSVGSPDQDEAASVHAYVKAAKVVYAKMPTSFGFFVGDEDPHFLPENEDLHREMLEAGVRHAFAVYPGAHTGYFWAEHQGAWIKAAVRFLRPAG
ncbi:MAG: alpha/beta hydrolase [Solirubrobacteraceae bacterium]